MGGLDMPLPPAADAAPLADAFGEISIGLLMAAFSAVRRRWPQPSLCELT